MCSATHDAHQQGVFDVSITKTVAPHGWRPVLWELGIVTLGVLVAIWAGELLSAYNWKSKAAAGEMALTGEAQYAGIVFAEQLTVAPCVIAQIDGLRAKAIAVSDTRLDVPAIETLAGVSVIRSPVRTLTTDAWTSLLNDGTSAHMKRSRESATAQYYAMLGTWVEIAQSARDLQDSLVVLSEPVPLEARGRYETLRTLGQLRNHIALQSLKSKFLLAWLRDLGRLPDAAALDAFEKAEAGKSTRSYCTARGLPLQDWRRVVETVKPEAI